MTEKKNREPRTIDLFAGSGGIDLSAFRVGDFFGPRDGFMVRTYPLPKNLEELAQKVYKIQKSRGDKSEIQDIRKAVVFLIMDAKVGDLFAAFGYDTTATSGNEMVDFLATYYNWKLDNPKVVEDFKARFNNKTEAEKELTKVFFGYFIKKGKAPSAVYIRRKRPPEANPAGYSLTAVPFVPKALPVSFNDYQLRNAFWSLDVGETITREIEETTTEDGTPLAGGLVEFTKTEGPTLDDWDYLVAAALWNVSRYNEAINRLTNKPESYATTPLIVLQLTGNKDLAYPRQSNSDPNKKRCSIVYTAVEESIKKIAASKWAYDASDLAKNRDTGGIVADVAPALVVRRVKIRTVDTKKIIEAWIVNDSWWFTLLNAFGNRHNFQLYQRFFPQDVRDVETLKLYCLLIKGATNKGKAQKVNNTFFVDSRYSGKAKTIQQILGWEHLRIDSVKLRVERMLDYLSATGCFTVKKLKTQNDDGKPKTLYGFTIKLLQGVEPKELPPPRKKE